MQDRCNISSFICMRIVADLFLRKIVTTSDFVFPGYNLLRIYRRLLYPIYYLKVQLCIHVAVVTVLFIVYVNFNKYKLVMLK